MSARWGAALLLALWGMGCSDIGESSTSQGGSAEADVPECTVDRACRDGKVCLSGRCYLACASHEQCAAREVCSESGSDRGVCVALAEELEPDPCDRLLCSGATPVCLTAAAQCVACTGDQHCASDAPVCDRGRGVCGERAAALCAPCSRDADCAATAEALGSAGKQESAFGASTNQVACVALPQTGEQVCVPSACTGDEACPGGFECLPSLRVCVPRRGSCTAYRAAELERACDSAQDCSALSVAGGSPYAGVCVAGECALGCIATADCPGARICVMSVCEPFEAEVPSPDAGA